MISSSPEDESCTSAEQGRGAVVLGTGSPPCARPWGWVYHFGNISNIKTPDPSVEIVQGAPHNCIVSCSYLMAVALGMVFCCCPSTSRSNVLSVQRYSSAYLGCNNCLFFLSFLSALTCPFSSDLWHQQGIFTHRTATHWIFSLFLTVLCKPYR